MRLASASVLGLGVVAAALIVRWPPSMDAGSSRAPQIVSYRVVLNSGRTSIGVVPSGRQLILKDFVSPHGNSLQVLADEVPVLDLAYYRDDYSGIGGVDSHFSAGIAIDSGQEVSLIGNSGNVVTVSGILE